MLPLMIAMVAASDDKKPLTILGIIGLLAVHAGFVFFTIHTFKNSPCYDCYGSNAASNVTSAADTTEPALNYTSTTTQPVNLNSTPTKSQTTIPLNDTTIAQAL